RRRSGLVPAAPRRQLPSPTWRRNGHRTSAACRRNRVRLVAAVHRRRKHQLGGGRRIRPLAAGGMGLWWGHTRPVSGKSGLLPVLALTAAKDRKNDFAMQQPNREKRTTSQVD